MRAKPVGWESLYYQAGSADKLLLIGFKNEKLKPLTGKTLAEVAKMRGTSPEDTAIDLVIEDGSRVATAYFLMDEANVARQVSLPWMALRQRRRRAGAARRVPQILDPPARLRQFRAAARQICPRRKARDASRGGAAADQLSRPPTSASRTAGWLAPGMIADLAIFDPATIADKATFDKPQQFAVGMRHVFVNGQPVLLDGEMTAARPGRAVRGPGWKRCPQQQLTR